jgi:hypothetical protein
VRFAFVLLLLASPVSAQTPVAGHYPPGQTGIRGAATPGPGWAVTNFNRFFSNLEVKDAHGTVTAEKSEMRFANITMITWNPGFRVLGLDYAAQCGIPFATGNLNPSPGDLNSKSFGLGDVLVTPVSLYTGRPVWDAQFQFSYWSKSGEFEPSGTKNRGAGFDALVWSLGGVWYTGHDRKDWSVSAISRFEQNFEQDETGIQPGDDVVVDWGIGKTMGKVEAGVSGFGTWQLSTQEGTSRYSCLGIGPEASWRPGGPWTLRARAHFEFAARNSVEGNGLWLIAHCAL